MRPPPLLPVRTGPLSDTGQTQCLTTAGDALEACSEDHTGNTSVRPGQDGRFGRDPAAANPAQSGLIKPHGSGGSGGFAFTPMDVNGNVIPLTGTLPTAIWYVRFDNGDYAGGDGPANGNRVRLVRSGQSFAAFDELGLPTPIPTLSEGGNSSC